MKPPFPTLRKNNIGVCPLEGRIERVVFCLPVFLYGFNLAVKLILVDIFGRSDVHAEQKNRDD